MTLKIFCVVSNDKNLTGFPVDFDVSLTVGDLKDAIRTKKSPELDYLAADKLTLVRICTGEVGGLTPDELERFRELLQLETYGEAPERTKDAGSAYGAASGACLAKDGLMFKVMNSMEQVSVFTELLPTKLYHVLVLVPHTFLATAMEMDYSPAFANSIHVPMTPLGLYEWLHGSATNSSENLSDNKVVSQEQVIAEYSTVFPLTGRDESLAHIKSCFLRAYEHRTSIDRNLRPIPVCTGVPGLGKTRMMKECPSTVLDMTGIPGERVSVLIS
ncbi:UNVERIFIED_CONTAM: hypothetical protein HDU68_005532, partial [Siphonaria sp. JEL0065]